MNKSWFVLSGFSFFLAGFFISWFIKSSSTVQEAAALRVPATQPSARTSIRPMSFQGEVEIGRPLIGVNHTLLVEVQFQDQKIMACIPDGLREKLVPGMKAGLLMVQNLNPQSKKDEDINIVIPLPQR